MANPIGQADHPRLDVGHDRSTKAQSVRHRQRIFGVLAIAIAAGAASAAPQVRLTADQADAALNNASLLMALDQTAAPQDYIAAARADYRRLLTALYAAGYYGGSVSITVDGVEAAAIAPLAAPAAIDNVVITVTAGDLFYFGSVAIAPLPPLTELPFDLGPRQVALSGRIGAAAAASVDQWRAQGHALARVASQQITARHAQAQLDVAIGLDPGPQLRFGPLVVTGNNAVRADRIRAIAGVPQGAVYSPQAVTQAESRLRRTGSFRSAALSLADQADPDGTITLRAQLDEAAPRRFGFGAEIGSVDGIEVSGFWLHRNLLGGAERLRIDAKVAGITTDGDGIDYELRGSFGRPASFGPDTDFYLTTEIAREDEPTFFVDRLALEAGITRYANETLTLRGGIGLLHARETSDLGLREYTLLTLPLGATLDRRDDPSNAKSGYFLEASLTPFVSFDGDLNGARFFGDARWYQSFGAADGVTLAARGQLGSLIGAGVTRAPADFLFYSGGGGSVRGQGYQSLGLTSLQGGQVVTTGGASFIGTQLEARYQMGGNLSVVGFYDLGYVGASDTPGRDGDWHAGAGLGLRYATGIGPIRLDIATPASGDDAGRSAQIYVGIGQAF
jgi:translocation and assembly module TamA